MTKKIEKIEEYSRDQYSIYGLWRIETDDDILDIAAVVGVPPYLVSTAQAAGSGRGMATAWTNHWSDWDGLTEDQREEAMGLLIEAAADLMEADDEDPRDAQ